MRGLLSSSNLPIFVSHLSTQTTMNTLKTIVLFSIIQLLSFTNWSQDSEHFNGTLTYRIERVDVNDSSEAKMMIFARDSLLKIVNFSTEFGRQESISHLGYQKKYILIELEEGKFAIQMAKAKGIKVAATVRHDSQKEVLENLGADLVINTETEKIGWW